MAPTGSEMLSRRGTESPSSRRSGGGAAGNGSEVPAGQTVKVVANTAAETYLVLPLRPADLPDDELDKIAGGAAMRTVNHPCTFLMNPVWSDYLP